MFLIGPRPAVLQNMLAELGQGVLDHSVFYVTKGFPCPKSVPPLVWRVVSPAFNPVAAFLTTGGLPPRARTLLGLPWSDRQERRYQRFAAVWRSRPVNWLWEHLPMRLRYNRFAQAGYAR